MQGRPQADPGQQGIDVYEQMMNTFTQQAKTFWKSMGAAGEPMALGIESFAQMQRAYIQWLRQAQRAPRERLCRASPSRTGRDLEIAKAAAGTASPERQNDSRVSC